MSTLTLKHSRRKAQQEKASGELVTRALKFTGIELAPISPEHEMRLLREYADKLEKASGELLETFGEDARHAVGLMNVERRRAIRRLARIMEERLKPKQLI